MRTVPMPESPSLTDRSRLTNRLALVPVLAAALACGDNRGGSVPLVRAALARLPSVDVIDVVGSDEMWPIFGPEAIQADLKIGQNGRLLLCDLAPESISGTRPFIIARVGDWAPVVHFAADAGRARYVAGCPESVDVGADTPFQQLVPFPVNSAADVVANYDRLKFLIEGWSETPTIAQDTSGRGSIEYRKQRFRRP